MANVITGSRIILSILLLFFTPFSPAFYALYLAAGLTDMIDGTVARKTGTVSEYGSRLDTFADIVFTAVCMVIILPLIAMPLWVYLWIAGIALIKLTNVLINYIRLKKLTSFHSVLNKIAGAALFFFPLSFNLIDTTLFAAALCVIATVAAIHESSSVLCHTS
jgi:CDP-diacylglycerol--glycerol-3-phosphate 3-phosphatidyltransferase